MRRRGTTPAVSGWADSSPFSGDSSEPRGFAEHGRDERRTEERFEKARRKAAGTEDSSEEDEPISQDRLNELRMRVASRELKLRVDNIMSFYYLVLAAIFVNFYFCVKSYGIDSAMYYHMCGGGLLCLLGAVVYVAANSVDNQLLVATGGMLFITGLPVIFMTFFVWVWISLFFKRSWREAWLSMVDIH